MSSKTLDHISRENYPIPNQLNIVLLISSSFISILVLYLANLQSSWWGLLFFAVIFSFVNNTTFALLHEATHGSFHSNKKVNNAAGVFLAAFFPTTFTLQTLYHLGHHRRNRTDGEMFDLYYEGESVLLKRIIIWGTVLGIYWTTPFISCVLFFINPNWLLSKEVRESEFMNGLKATPMLGGLNKALNKKLRIRLEFLFTLSVHFCLFYFLNLSFVTWIVCYWIFGMNWGSLQYADHVNSKRDIRNGAWNLKVNFIVQKIFLNYHVHLVHHRYPNIPWIHLPKLVDPNDPNPTYISKLFEWLTGPRLALEPSPKANENLNKVIYSDFD